MISLLRSVVAVLLGYAVFGASPFAVLRVSGRAPHAAAIGAFTIATIASGVVFAIAGGHVAGGPAGRRPIAHAAAIAKTLGHGAIWSPGAALTLMAATALLGGWARARDDRRSATPCAAIRRAAILAAGCPRPTRERTVPVPAVVRHA